MCADLDNGSMMMALLLVMGMSGSAMASRLDMWIAGRPVPAEDAGVSEGYRFARDGFREVSDLVEAHPDRVTVESIGNTTQGQPIFAFHVQGPGEEPKRSVLVFAGIHALEWISTEVALDLLVESIEAPPHDVRLTVIPLLNPDGRVKVERDLLAKRNAYRRGNGPNVDLNRDFAVNRTARAVWRHIIPGYYASTGAALSQPESTALDRLAQRERYDRAASLHAFGAYHYFPWAGRFERPDDWAEFVRIGRAMERAQGAHAYRTRQLSHWGFFFRAQGAELDHLYGQYGTEAFLIELTRSGIRSPKDLRTYFRWYNPRNVARHRRKGLAAVRALVREE